MASPDAKTPVAMGTDDPAVTTTTTIARPRLTLTGADERTDVSALAKLDAELGILYSMSPEGRHRYPRWEWIRDAAAALRNVSLHVCGRGARAELLAGKLAVEAFQRIQVNGNASATEIEHLCAMYPTHTIITQHNHSNYHLLVVGAANHAVLVDSSAGEGRSPAMWIHPDTPKLVGFAGGLGPDNLARELRRIAAVSRLGWWVDMESKLRVDDWFSIERAAECVAIASAQARAA